MYDSPSPILADEIEDSFDQPAPARAPSKSTPLSDPQPVADVLTLDPTIAVVLDGEHADTTVVSLDKAARRVFKRALGGVQFVYECAIEQLSDWMRSADGFGMAPSPIELGSMLYGLVSSDLAFRRLVEAHTECATARANMLGLPYSIRLRSTRMAVAAMFAWRALRATQSQVKLQHPRTHTLRCIPIDDNVWNPRRYGTEAASKRPRTSAPGYDEHLARLLSPHGLGDAPELPDSLPCGSAFLWRMSDRRFALQVTTISTAQTRQVLCPLLAATWGLALPADSLVCSVHVATEAARALVLSLSEARLLHAGEHMTVTAAPIGESLYVPSLPPPPFKTNRVLGAKVSMWRVWLEASGDTESWASTTCALVRASGWWPVDENACRYLATCFTECSTLADKTRIRATSVYWWQTLGRGKGDAPILGGYRRMPTRLPSFVVRLGSIIRRCSLTACMPPSKPHGNNPLSCNCINKTNLYNINMQSNGMRAWVTSAAALVVEGGVAKVPTLQDETLEEWRKHLLAHAHRLADERDAVPVVAKVGAVVEIYAADGDFGVRDEWMCADREARWCLATYRHGAWRDEGSQVVRYGGRTVADVLPSREVLARLLDAGVRIRAWGCVPAVVEHVLSTQALAELCVLLDASAGLPSGGCGWNAVRECTRRSQRLEEVQQRSVADAAFSLVFRRRDTGVLDVSLT